MIKTNNADMN